MQHGQLSGAVAAMKYVTWPYIYCSGVCKVLANPTSDMLFQVRRGTTSITSAQRCATIQISYTDGHLPAVAYKQGADKQRLSVHAPPVDFTHAACCSAAQVHGHHPTPHDTGKPKEVPQSCAHLLHFHHLWGLRTPQLMQSMRLPGSNPGMPLKLQELLPSTGGAAKPVYKQGQTYYII